jgi:ketosteroid isomerase-like protein
MSEESTTPDLVELTRQAIDAMTRGDLDAAISYAAPDMVFDAPRHGVGTFEGAEAMRGFLEDWVGAFEELQFAFEELFDVGNGVVFAAVSQKARPVGTTGYVRQREMGLAVDRGPDRHSHRLPRSRNRRGPHCRRMPRRGTGVGGGAGEPRTPRTRRRGAERPRALGRTGCVFCPLTSRPQRRVCEVRNQNRDATG